MVLNEHIHSIQDQESRKFIKKISVIKKGRIPYLSSSRAIKKFFLPIIGGIIGVIISSLLIQSYFNRPIIDYYFDTPQSYHSYGVQSIYFNFQNRGGLDAHATFIVTFTNVTFSDQTDMPYQKVNNSTVRFYYVLIHNMEARGRREAYFTINDGVAGFSIDLSVECNYLFAEKIGYYKTSLHTTKPRMIYMN